MHWEEKRSSISIAAVGNSILETNSRYKKEVNDEEMEENDNSREKHEETFEEVPVDKIDKLRIFDFI